MITFLKIQIQFKVQKWILSRNHNIGGYRPILYFDIIIMATYVLCAQIIS